MTSNTALNIADDLIDRLVDLHPDSTTYALRHQRDKVAIATQGSYEALFDPALVGPSLSERLLVALYACRLSDAPALASHYRTQIEQQSVDPASLSAVEHGTPTDVDDKRLRTILTFTRTLIENPVAGDKSALQTLPAAGLTTPAVVALAQLIAFLSYQIRLVTGLQALKSLETSA